MTRSNRATAGPAPTPSLVELHDAATKVINTGKKDVFPIAGKRAKIEKDSLDLEEALLIDPTRDDPDGFLEYHIDPDHLIGLVLPRRKSKAPPRAPCRGRRCGS